MATTKTKGTNKKIKELKGVKPEKVSEEHFNEIKKLINSINQSYNEIGRLEAQKHNQLHVLAGSNDEMTLMQDKLQKEYGTNDINVYDGTINYPKENGEVNKKD